MEKMNVCVIKKLPYESCSLPLRSGDAEASGDDPLKPNILLKHEICGASRVYQVPHENRSKHAEVASRVKVGGRSDAARDEHGHRQHDLRYAQPHGRRTRVLLVRHALIWKQVTSARWGWEVVE